MKKYNLKIYIIVTAIIFILNSVVSAGPCLREQFNSCLRNPLASNQKSDETRIKEKMVEQIIIYSPVVPLKLQRLEGRQGTVLVSDKKTLSQFEVFQLTWEQILKGNNEFVLDLGAGTAERTILYAIEGVDLNKYILPKILLMDISAAPPDFLKLQDKLDEGTIDYLPFIDLNEAVFPTIGTQLVPTPVKRLRDNRYFNNTRCIIYHGVLDYQSRHAIHFFLHQLSIIEPEAVSIRLIPANHYDMRERIIKAFGKEEANTIFYREIEGIKRVLAGDYDVDKDKATLHKGIYVCGEKMEIKDVNLPEGYHGTVIMPDVLVGYLKAIGFDEIILDTYSLTGPGHIDSILIFGKRTAKWTKQKHKDLDMRKALLKISKQIETGAEVIIPSALKQMFLSGYTPSNINHQCLLNAIQEAREGQNFSILFAVQACIEWLTAVKRMNINAYLQTQVRTAL
ncbi:MAG: hypothetical protein KKD11_02770 [Candidatus Omnitrophica bacterium]|nr:hypothetical protein [Candidatus Omnitrophota bacterium]